MLHITSKTEYSVSVNSNPHRPEAWVGITIIILNRYIEIITCVCQKGLLIVL